MTTLPQPEISVNEIASGSDHVEISITAKRDGKDRTWSGVAPTHAGAVKGAVEKMLGDPHTAEYVKR